MSDDNQKNQGEGNKTADRDYREGVEDFIDSGKVEDAAEKAKDALESDEAEELEKAESDAKTGPDV